MSAIFHTTKEEFTLILKIAERAEHLGFCQNVKRIETLMDLAAAHANGCPMDFDAMLNAGDIDFAYDFWGIRNHLDRSNGRLGSYFTPRFRLTEGVDNGAE